MLEQIKEFVHTLKELVDIYHKHDASVNERLDLLVSELKALNEKGDVLIGFIRRDHI